MWENQVDALCKHFTVITYDLRGFGQSILPGESPYSHEEDYQAILRSFGFQRAHVVGLSLGGRMAIRCALSCPESVASLILLDSAVDGYNWSIDWQNEWLPMVVAAREGALTAARDLWANHSLFERANANPGLRKGLHTMIGQYSGWHWIHQDPAIVPQPPALLRLHEIASPTLVVTGEYEIPDFKEIAELFSAGIPMARQLVVPNAGHMVNIEAIDVTNAAIMEFLSTHTPRPSP